ncbi:MAG: glycosyltransferase family protein [Elusimicrobia bacterium]|nr:glycosyltransferase family protein [Elusimicrobiota bacterium]
MTSAVFSIICVYNDEGILNNWLLAGLKDQTRGFELIKVDNTGGAFKSAAEALNYGAKNAKGEYLMFIHQDVRLISEDWPARAEKFLRDMRDLGVAGVAGMVKTKNPGMISFGTIPTDNRVWEIYHGHKKELSVYNRILSGCPAEVQTLDEQLLLAPRKVFGELKFDGAACPGWHLYAVDYALSVKKLGLKAYVLPLPVWHMSNGNINRGYYAALINVLKKHREEKAIYTTCGLWHTSRFVNCLSLFFLAVRGELGRWVGRNDRGGGFYMARLKMFLGI